MKYFDWDEDRLLTTGESIIYKCELEDELRGKTYLILTNLRIINTQKIGINSMFLKSVATVGIFKREQEDIYDGTTGSGDYMFNVDNWTYRFYAENVRDTFYEETLRAIADCF